MAHRSRGKKYFNIYSKVAGKWNFSNSIMEIVGRDGGVE